MNKDYIFHINWEDRYKHSYRVGILAEIDEVFYLAIKSEKDAVLAYKSGFIGIPGFKTEEVYRSSELFDFFKNRILETSKANASEELARSKAVSMTDSFSVEEISKNVSKKYKRIILEAYELQERKADMQEKNKEVKNEQKDSSNSIEDI